MRSFLEASGIKSELKINQKPDPQEHSQKDIKNNTKLFKMEGEGNGKTVPRGASALFLANFVASTPKMASRAPPKP